jgi:alpha-amylase
VADTGIFEFMRHLPRAVLAHCDGAFVTPSEAVHAFPAVAELDVPDFVSWADEERDLTAWTGNAMQRSALRAVFELREPVYATGDPALIDDWRRLTSSDHFYYMCTKFFADGDVHKYFSPYESPYEAYIAMLNVLSDLALRAGSRAWRPPQQ